MACISRWGGSESPYLVDAPPWWGEPAMTAVLKTADVSEVIMKRMCWSVWESGILCTRWRVTCKTCTATRRFLAGERGSPLAAVPPPQGIRGGVLLRE